MVEKVLVVEDFDFIHSGIGAVLDEIGIKKVDSISYCDEAFIKLKKLF